MTTGRLDGYTCDTCEHTQAQHWHKARRDNDRSYCTVDDCTCFHFVMKRTAEPMVDPAQLQQRLTDAYAEYQADATRWLTDGFAAAGLSELVSKQEEWLRDVCAQTGMTPEELAERYSLERDPVETVVGVDGLTIRNTQRVRLRPREEETPEINQPTGEH